MKRMIFTPESISDLFVGQSITIGKSGEKVSIQCDSSGDAELLFSWLENVAADFQKGLFIRQFCEASHLRGSSLHVVLESLFERLAEEPFVEVKFQVAFTESIRFEIELPSHGVVNESYYLRDYDEYISYMANAFARQFHDALLLYIRNTHQSLGSNVSYKDAFSVLTKDCKPTWVLMAPYDFDWMCRKGLIKFSENQLCRMPYIDVVMTCFYADDLTYVSCPKVAEGHIYAAEGRVDLWLGASYNKEDVMGFWSGGFGEKKFYGLTLNRSEKEE